MKKIIEQFKIIDDNEYIELKEETYVLISSYPTQSFTKKELSEVIREHGNKLFTRVGSEYIRNLPEIKVGYNSPSSTDQTFLRIKDKFMIRELTYKDSVELLEIMRGESNKYFNRIPFLMSRVNSIPYNEDTTRFHTIYGVYKVVSQVEGKRLFLNKRFLLDNFFRYIIRKVYLNDPKELTRKIHTYRGGWKYFIKYRILRESNSEDNFPELPKRYGKKWGYISKGKDYYVEVPHEKSKEKSLLYKILKGVRNPKAIVWIDEKSYVVSLELRCYLCSHDINFSLIPKKDYNENN